MRLDKTELEKLHPSPFREAVERGRTGPLEIFVQLEAPAAVVDIDREAIRKGFGSPRPRGVIASRGPIATEAIRRAIEKIVGTEPVAPYGSNSTFVVDATPDQICRIAELDAVAEIWPNSRFAEFDSR
jgi:hypothetical protein